MEEIKDNIDLKEQNQKIVINRCYGGFCVSKKAYEYCNKKWDGYGFDISRTNKKLIEFIEKYGSDRASGDVAKLKIVEIPKGVEWEIEDYDGIEWVAEKHRCWE